MTSNLDNRTHQNHEIPQFREFLATEIAELVMIGKIEQLSER